MKGIKREDIQIIAQHSNWTEKGIHNTLKKYIYNDKESWSKFLRVFFASLGVGFTTAGIIFFFAYNWADLHKFIKIGLIESLILMTTLIIIFSKISLDVKNILLTGASILVGVLFAVFGQIYQTGANAYDFFLGWTMCIAIWVLISNYAPLWLVFIILINTTLILYSEQVAYEWSDVFVYTLLFIINTLFLTVSFFIKKINRQLKVPVWFTNLLALASVSYSTLLFISGIFSKEHQISFFVLIIMTTILYGVGIKYGQKMKSGLYLSIIPLSIIVIISAFLIKLSDNAGMFLFVGLFAIVSVTYIINYLIYLLRNEQDS